MAASAHVFEVDEAQFERDVLERSKTTPVLIDFWADWCQPCRMLGPLLEKLASEYDGRFVLAKADTEKYPYLAAQFGVQGIPAVFLVIDGTVIDQFVGFQPEQSIREFLERRLPSEADKIASRAASFVLQDPVGARRMYEQALLLDREHGPSLAGLASLLVEAGELTQARAFVERVERHGPGWEQAEQVLTRIQLKENAASGGSIAELQKNCAENPNDLDARMKLGSAYAAEDQPKEALETWVAIVESNRDFGSEHVRPLMVAMFKALGEENPLVGKYRQRLASALY